MKAYIDGITYYPNFFLTHEEDICGREIEVTLVQFRRIKKAELEFMAVQGLIAGLMPEDNDG